MIRCSRDVVPLSSHVDVYIVICTNRKQLFYNMPDCSVVPIVKDFSLWRRSVKTSVR